MRHALLVSALFISACGHAPTAPSAAPTALAATPVMAIFLTPNRWDLPPAGGSLDITVETSASLYGGTSAPHAHVELQTSTGTLSAESVDTDQTGHARVTWTGTTNATVFAQVGDVLGIALITIVRPPAPPPNGPPPPPLPPSPQGPLPLFVTIFADQPMRGFPMGVPILLGPLVRDGYGRGVEDVSYAWDFNSDGTIDSTLRSPTATYTREGTYTIQLTVRRANGDGGHGQLTIQIVDNGLK